MRAIKPRLGGTRLVAMNTTGLLLFQSLRLPPQHQEISSCASQILERYSETKSCIVYEDVGLLVDNIMKKEMPTSTRIINITKHLQYKVNEIEAYFMVTIIVRNLEEMRLYFEATYRILGWNSRAKHLVVYIGDEDLDLVFKVLWDKFVLKAVVVDKEANLYWYQPVAPGNCGRFVHKKLLGSCSAINYTKIDEIYRISGLGNYQGCEVRVLAFPMPPYVIDVQDKKEPGFEIVVLRELSKRLNFTIRYVAHNFTYWGHKNPGGGYTNLYKMLLNREADLLLGMVVANGSFLYDFDASIAHTKSDLAFFLPAPKLQNPWDNILRVFGVFIWVSIGCCCIVLALLWYAVARMGENAWNVPEGYNRLSKCILVIFGITVCNAMPQPKSPALRYLFVVWALCCLVLASTFESSLTSFLTKPAYTYKPETVDDLVAAGYTCGGFEYARELFKLKQDNPSYNKIYQDWVTCTIDESCVNKTATGANFAALNDIRYINYLTPKYYLRKDGTSKLYQMPVLSSFYMWILMLKGIPLRDDINRMLQYFIEFGLMNKWIRDVTHTKVQKEKSEEIPLRFDHIMFPVVILGGGILVGLVAFLLELRVGGVGSKARVVPKMVEPAPAFKIYAE